MEKFTWDSIETEEEFKVEFGLPPSSPPSTFSPSSSSSPSFSFDKGKGVEREKEERRKEERMKREEEENRLTDNDSGSYSSPWSPFGADSPNQKEEQEKQEYLDRLEQLSEAARRRPPRLSEELDMDVGVAEEWGTVPLLGEEEREEEEEEEGEEGEEEREQEALDMDTEMENFDVSLAYTDTEAAPLYPDEDAFSDDEEYSEEYSLLKENEVDQGIDQSSSSSQGPCTRVCGGGCLLM